MEKQQIKDCIKEIQDIIKRLEILRETLHPHEARHIDEAILELEYYLID